MWCGNKCTALQRQGNHTAKSEIIQESFVEPHTSPAALGGDRNQRAAGEKGMNVDLLGESADTKSENISL